MWINLKWKAGLNQPGYVEIPLLKFMEWIPPYLLYFKTHGKSPSVKVYITNSFLVDEVFDIIVAYISDETITCNSSFLTLITRDNTKPAMLNRRELPTSKF